MSTSTHPFAPEDVMAFLDGELPPERAQSASAHTNECTECQKIRDSFVSISQALADWVVPTSPAKIEEQVSRTSTSTKHSAGQFISDMRGFLRPRSTLAWGGAAVAAAVLLLVFLGSIAERPALMTMQARRSPSESVVFPPSPATKTYLHPPPGTTRASQAGAGGRGGKLSKTDAGKSLQTFDERKPAWTPSGPMIARTVLLAIVVKDFDADRASLDAILGRYKGYAATLNVSTPQGSARTLQASLRIPSSQLAPALSELKKLGRVENETQSGEEVTQQHADLLARLKNSRETEQRLQDVLRTRTGKVKDVLEVEEEIARVRGDIEQMEAEQKTLEHRVDFATIDLKLAEEYKAQLNTPAPSILMQLRNAAVNGFRNAFESLLALVLFLAESCPSLLLWLALLGIPAWRLWRRYRRAQTLAPLAGA